MRYRVVKEYYSREEIKVLKSKKSNLKFNNRERWRFHFDDNAKYNAELQSVVDERIPRSKKTSSPIIPNGVENDALTINPDLTIK